MNFEFQRNLTNQVFTTNVVWTSYGDGHYTAEQEQALIEDFGPIVIDIGGTYKAKASINATTGKYEVIPNDAASNVEFVVNNAKLELKKGLLIPFVSDAKKLTTDDMAKVATTDFKDKPLKLAEVKCVIFEKIIQDRIETALVDFKNKFTNFENESPASFGK